jgi:uncharacterized protein (TIRG00374 family)
LAEVSSISLRKSIVIILTGLIGFIVYLYFFVGFDEILMVLREVNPADYSFYYSMTFIAIMLSVVFYALTWHELLEALSINVGLQNTFLYCLLANFVDLIIPLEAVTGELTRVYFLYKESNDHFGKSVASVVSHRIISNVFALSALIVSSLALIRYAENVYMWILLALVIAGTAATIIGLFYLALSDGASSRLIEFLIRATEVITRNRVDLSEVKDKTEKNLAYFHEGVRTLGEYPKNLVKAMVYTFISWLCHLSIYFFVFYALGYTRAVFFIPQMIVVFSISLAIQTIPVGIPVGLVEIVMTSLYALFGIPPGLGGIATTLIRVVTYWFQVIVGYVVLQLMGVKTLLSTGNE